ncbi:MAG: CPBP family intramembrane metalloprotease [Lachnospiraceae bacterium]|nr:CPBP family intramembrane metalloprotease [Lachnospiraceae bacterium]
MTDEKKSSFQKILDILLPFAIYFVVHDLAQVALIVIANTSLRLLGEDWRELMSANQATVNGILNALSMWIGIGAIWSMAKKEFLYGKENCTKKELKGITIIFYFLLILFAAAFALAINILLSLTGLTSSSQSYGEVAQRQYGVSFEIGLLVYGLCSPLAEEIVFRGLVYHRMKKYFSVFLSVILNSLLFGIYHGNLVQAVYAGILGITITLAYEIYGSFAAPVLFHAAANICVYTIGYHQQLQRLITVRNGVIFMLVAVLIGGIMGKGRGRVK